jgi:transposase-like protein
MSAYLEEMRRCQRVLALRAALDAGGNQCAAARVLGVHRNTISRAVRSAGYTSEQLKRMSRIHAGEKKPPMAEPLSRTGNTEINLEGELKCS